MYLNTSGPFVSRPVGFCTALATDLVRTGYLTSKKLRLVCVCLFTIMLTYYCMDLTTKGLWPLDRAKVFAVPPLLVQTISLGDKVLSIARLCCPPDGPNFCEDKG